MSKVLLIYVFTIAFTLVACGLSEEEMKATVVTDLTENAPTSTFTPLPTSTSLPTDTPTITPTQTIAPTRTPTPTSTSTPTPAPGSFANPAPIGMEMVRLDGTINEWEMSAELLDIKRGEDENEVAKKELGWILYNDPVEGQEYLYAKVKINFLKTVDENKVELIIPYFHLTLRYSETGSDIWSQDYGKWAEGYVPIEAEGWVLFLVKEGTEPLLYFHPQLMVTETYGVRTGGAFFSLEIP